MCIIFPWIYTYYDHSIVILLIMYIEKLFDLATQLHQITKHCLLCMDLSSTPFSYFYFQSHNIPNITVGNGLGLKF